MLIVEDVSKFFGTTQILKNLSFKIDRGSFTSVFGPNGSGKTTLLNILSGLDTPSSGRLVWELPSEKNTSYVFQNYRETLFPWKNLQENIALPLKLKGVGFNIRKKKVAKLIQKFSIDIDLSKFPYQLSGGQQQLVAIMRALITKPNLLLLDEPFSALDFERRLFLQAKILEIWKETKVTIILVSHDLEEAIYMADKVLLLGDKPTRIVEEKTISLKYPRTPKDLVSPNFVKHKDFLLKQFLGNSTFLPTGKHNDNR